MNGFIIPIHQQSNIMTSQHVDSTSTTVWNNSFSGKCYTEHKWNKLNDLKSPKQQCVYI